MTNDLYFLLVLRLENRDKLEVFLLPSKIRTLGEILSKGKHRIERRGRLEYLSQVECEISLKTVLPRSMLVDVLV